MASQQAAAGGRGRAGTSAGRGGGGGGSSGGSGGGERRGGVVVLDATAALPQQRWVCLELTAHAGSGPQEAAKLRFGAAIGEYLSDLAAAGKTPLPAAGPAPWSPKPGVLRARVHLPPALQPAVQARMREGSLLSLPGVPGGYAVAEWPLQGGTATYRLVGTPPELDETAVRDALSAAGCAVLRVRRQGHPAYPHLTDGTKLEVQLRRTPHPVPAALQLSQPGGAVITMRLDPVRPELPSLAAMRDIGSPRAPAAGGSQQQQAQSAPAAPAPAAHPNQQPAAAAPASKGRKKPRRQHQPAQEDTAVLAASVAAAAVAGALAAAAPAATAADAGPAAPAAAATVAQAEASPAGSPASGSAEQQGVAHALAAVPASTPAGSASLAHPGAAATPPSSAEAHMREVVLGKRPASSPGEPAASPTTSPHSTLRRRTNGGGGTHATHA